MEYKIKRVRAITQIKMIRLDKVMVVDGGEHGVGCWVLGVGEGCRMESSALKACKTE